MTGNLPQSMGLMSGTVYCCCLLLLYTTDVRYCIAVIDQCAYCIAVINQCTYCIAVINQCTYSIAVIDQCTYCIDILLMSGTVYRGDGVRCVWCWCER
jgi:hypothetical protein